MFVVELNAMVSRVELSRVKFMTSHHHTCLQNIHALWEKYIINISPPTLIIYLIQYFLKCIKTLSYLKNIIKLPSGILIYKTILCHIRMKPKIIVNMFLFIV